ncbi:MAG: ABC transporter permease [Lachnospiraceae bacterium]|nr:ABC transporter permease [Lachnospiraceae bacterium]MBQ8971287.1 ABC transporter permease [Lachnospiraceae bacterium]MBR2275026.1 ABC transporter permease [Lachnospiraceae bacterium]
MRVFNLFFKIARTKLGITILYLAVFLVICFPLVKATQKQVSFEEATLSLFVDDRDQSEASRRLIEQLSEKNEIVELENDKQVIMDAMYYDIVDYSLVIKEGFEEKLQSFDQGALNEGLFESYHMRDSYAVAMMGVFLSEYVRDVRMKLAMGYKLSEAIDEAEKMLNVQIPVEIITDPEREVADKDFTENFAVFFRLLCYLLLVVITNALCPVLLCLNREDQKKRIECTRISTSSFVRQIFLGSAVLVLIIWLVYMAAGTVLYGGMYRGRSCFLAIGNSFLFAMFCAMFAVFLCTLSRNTTVVGMISQIFGLGMAFLCGAFIPQSMMDDKVLSAVRILPGYWYVRATDILSGAQTGTLQDVQNCFLIQAGFVLLFLVLTILGSSGKRLPRLKHA